MVLSLENHKLVLTKARFYLILVLTLLVLFTRFWQLDNPDPSTDEMHYIKEAALLSMNDPNINPRHHMFHHPTPNFPHPFLVGDFIAISFKTFDYSVFAGRLPGALFSFLTVFVVFIFVYLLSKKFKLAYTAALFSAMLPINIRYARELYLDSILAFFIILTALFWWLFLKKKSFLYAVLTGICLGLAVSTKITGIALFVPILVTGLFNFKQLKKHYLKLTFLVPAFALVFVLLNSPQAYLSGLTYHPNTRTANWGIESILTGIFSPKYFSYWFYMLIYNFTLPIVALSGYGIYKLFKDKKTQLSKNFQFVLIFLISYLVFAVSTHLPSGISGPWAYQPELNLLVTLAAYGLFKTNYRSLILIGTLFYITLLSLLHGFRISNDPFVAYHNLKFNENYTYRILSDIKLLTTQKTPLYIHLAFDDSALPDYELPAGVNFKAWEYKDRIDLAITDKAYYAKDLEKDYFLYKTYNYSKIKPVYLYLRKDF
ncbi:MAG: phospholipid carrier-dependent glycosyltransferase [Candidatus Curtissbacteria bacterium]